MKRDFLLHSMRSEVNLCVGANIYNSQQGRKLYVRRCLDREQNIRDAQDSMSAFRAYVAGYICRQPRIGQLDEVRMSGDKMQNRRELHKSVPATQTDASRVSLRSGTTTAAASNLPPSATPIHGWSEYE